MLPRLDRLALCPTGEFYALTQTEADEHGIEPFSQEPYLVGQGRGSSHATFCVRNKNPQLNGAYGHTCFDAKELWDWVKDRGHNNPLTNEPIWREDWWELFEQYAKLEQHRFRGRMPLWVLRLPRRDPSQQDMHIYGDAGMGGRVRDPPHAEDAEEDAAWGNPHPPPQNAAPMQDEPMEDWQPRPPQAPPSAANDVQALDQALTRYDGLTLDDDDQNDAVIGQLNVMTGRITAHMHVVGPYNQELGQFYVFVINRLVESFRVALAHDPSGMGGESTILALLHLLYRHREWFVVEQLFQTGVYDALRAYMHAPGRRTSARPGAEGRIYPQNLLASYICIQ